MWEISNSSLENFVSNFMYTSTCTRSLLVEFYKKSWARLLYLFFKSSELTEVNSIEKNFWGTMTLWDRIEAEWSFWKMSNQKTLVCSGVT